MVDAETTAETDQGPEGADVQTGNPELSGRPFVTWLAVLLCAVVFLGISAEPKRDSWESLAKWGYRPANDIWNGHPLPLVSSAFVHLELWHIAFNVYWLLLFGSCLERAIGHGYFLLFYLVAALVSSTAELAVADTTGIGASGVVYAMFGFMWTGRRRFPTFEVALTQQTVALFMIWLVGCIAATQLNIWEVGNTAHVAGLLFGVSAAACTLARSHRKPLIAGLCGLVALSLMPLVWCPWSPLWLSTRAYRAHERGNYQLAVDYYGQVLRREPKNAWAFFNRGLAYEALMDADHAEADFKQADALDPSFTARPH